MSAHGRKSSRVYRGQGEPRVCAGKHHLLPWLAREMRVDSEPRALWGSSWALLPHLHMGPEAPLQGLSSPLPWSASVFCICLTFRTSPKSPTLSLCHLCLGSVP